MENPDMKFIERLIRNSKYIVATAPLWDVDKQRAKNVSLMGFSNKKGYDDCFDRWNNGFNDFLYGINVEDGKIVDEKGRILDVTYIWDYSNKSWNEDRKKRGDKYVC